VEPWDFDKYAEPIKRCMIACCYPVTDILAIDCSDAYITA